ncbi:hypothetical protein SNOG_03106 [Parastagonospora nodorum SN15]|uniref:Uncharacterized protein n=1 Tax=Phaeosphaeria nodorum (strain SN15 / ATCC MYA-4574 / FGSC 10173) TaxID=321614 RepID=Q0UYQ8_PHANO|nr:hypothetical protein SNOG_03106 [Parastagonospora nodorum SN15]EAT89837.2 hypothetical protein SNOG_03106 [Parastagonospora nodorum SN15]
MASTTSNKHPLLLAAAVAHGVLALGHTTKGLDQFKHPSLNTLPTALRGAVQAGWYEGSVFFAIMGNILKVVNDGHIRHIRQIHCYALDQLAHRCRSKLLQERR